MRHRQTHVLCANLMQDFSFDVHQFRQSFSARLHVINSNTAQAFVFINARISW